MILTVVFHCLGKLSELSDDDRIADLGCQLENPILINLHLHKYRN